jgi:hypothetical protein
MGLISYLFGKSKKITKRGQLFEIDELFNNIINTQGYLIDKEKSLTFKYHL